MTLRLGTCSPEYGGGATAFALRPKSPCRPQRALSVPQRAFSVNGFLAFDRVWANCPVDVPYHSPKREPGTHLRPSANNLRNQRAQVFPLDPLPPPLLPGWAPGGKLRS
jgi:hypothetical protein